MTPERMLDEVVDGLSRPQKWVSPKFFYDRRGSELFEEITRQPEYYPTRAERHLLKEHVPVWIDDLRPASLVELGAGAADKTTLILDAMHQTVATPTYVPVDISGEFLDRVAGELRVDYPALDVQPVVADMTVGFHLPADLARPALFALLGGTIGNFPEEEAVGQLRRIRSEMGASDRFLLGCDLQKEVEVLEAAYNDAAGVTAAFNLNMLRVLNRELGADFDPEDFDHHAFYDSDENRIEMHLVARRPVTVTIPDGGTFEFRAGESLHTEISCKYTRGSVEALMGRAGLQVERWTEGDPGFALALARPVEPQ